MSEIGRKTWAIAEGFIPSDPLPRDPALMSHESACLLNPNGRDAAVKITVFFSDREPCGPYLITVPKQRSLHVRFNDLKDPAPIPRDTDYASIIESDVPIVVQHTRLDSRDPAVAVLSTVAYANG